MRTLLPEDLDQRSFRAMADTNTYVVRILDDELRGLVAQLKGRVGALALEMQSEEQAASAISEVVDLFAAANDRVGELLRTLY